MSASPISVVPPGAHDHIHTTHGLVGALSSPLAFSAPTPAAAAAIPTIPRIPRSAFRRGGGGAIFSARGGVVNFPRSGIETETSTAAIGVSAAAAASAASAEAASAVAVAAAAAFVLLLLQAQIARRIAGLSMPLLGLLLRLRLPRWLLLEPP